MESIASMADSTLISAASMTAARRHRAHISATNALATSLALRVVKMMVSWLSMGIHSGA